jgi:hypothetical protein
MKVFTAGKSVDVTLPLIDESARNLSPTALSYRVLDEEGAEVQASTPIVGFSPTATKISIAVSSATNTLATGTIGFRRVELTVVSPLGQFKLTSDYLLEAEQMFVIPTNSFMTYETALVVARQVTPLNGWDVATPETRKFALFRAFDQMKAFIYTMRYVDGTEEELAVDELESATFLELKTSQITDFRKAQLIQADYILGGSPIEKDIQDGLQSSTIGEISQFYRPRPTLNLALCRSALGYVGKYINWSMRVGRA